MTRMKSIVIQGPLPFATPFQNGRQFARISISGERQNTISTATLWAPLFLFVISVLFVVKN